ncbi:hypothetical protein V7147_06715 [Bacillus sp. JJ1521]|uniref:hypothetical protein n=1 Tax=Bacillus sp. JJ1521 TaxID=3122957 RepID=UPI002FFDEFE7
MIFIVLLSLILIILFLYFVLRSKQQAIQAFTIESFINTHQLENENQNKGLIDTLNNFFEDESDNGESDGGGDGGD